MKGWLLIRFLPLFVWVSFVVTDLGEGTHRPGSAVDLGERRQGQDAPDQGGPAPDAQGSACGAAGPPITGAQRAPVVGPPHPTIGPPIGVEPSQASAHSAMTRPRMVGLA